MHVEELVYVGVDPQAPRNYSVSTRQRPDPAQRRGLTHAPERLLSSLTETVRRDP